MVFLNNNIPNNFKILKLMLSITFYKESNKIYVHTCHITFFKPFKTEQRKY